MDHLYTKVAIPRSHETISHETRCLLMGSCFSDYIGKIMAGYKFPLLMNPFGTLFNPASIANNVSMLTKGKEFSGDDLYYNDGNWLSFSHYTGFSDPDKDKCLDKINSAMREASQWLKQSEFLILTFGTAWTYHFNETGKPVANCHRLPASAFSKTLMQPGQVVSRYLEMIHEIRDINPGLKLIFTVSPVRHWADGAVNNQLSKSVLHYSIQEILKQTENTWYFPAYEIFMDELRDYRFYATDMLHPSEQGTHYVWERFCEAWVDEQSIRIVEELQGVLKAVNHRSVNPESAAHKKFVENTLSKINALQKRFPFLDFQEEIKTVNGSSDASLR